MEQGTESILENASQVGGEMGRPVRDEGPYLPEQDGSRRGLALSCWKNSLRSLCTRALLPKGRLVCLFSHIRFQSPLLHMYVVKRCPKFAFFF